MKLNGEETAAIYRKWAENEIAALPVVRVELGKFFFGVSSATLGLLVTLENRTPSTFRTDTLLLSIVALLLASVLSALLLVKPPIWALDSPSSLVKEHAKHVAHLRFGLWIWFGLWVVAVMLWILHLVL